VPSGATVDLQVTGRGGVPATDVSAVVLNTTVVSPAGRGFLTAWPTGEPRPLASNLHRRLPLPPPDPGAPARHTRGQRGQSGLGEHARPAVDRPGRRAGLRRVRGVLNVVVTQPASAGYLPSWPTGEVRPLASSLNFVAGQTAANLVMVKVGAGGKVSFYNGGGGSHLVADVAGWFGPPGENHRRPVPPP